MGGRKSAVVKFHRDLYPEAAVKAAALEYAGVAAIRLSREGAYLKAVLTLKSGGAAEALAGEFANRALFNSL